MAIELTTITPKTPQRLRLAFSNSLAGGAFGAAPVFYTLTPNTALGSPTLVRAALVIIGQPSVVELALSDELQPGASYIVTAIGVPAIDASVSTVASTQQFTFAAAVNSHILQVEARTDDGEVLLYGRDLIWTGSDFQETSNGDLARVSGANNAVAAVERRLFSDGLPWNSAYGAKPRQYVDAVPGVMGNLRTSLLGQAYADDRVKKVSVTYAFDTNDQINFSVDIDLIGDHKPDSISVTVKS